MIRQAMGGQIGDQARPVACLFLIAAPHLTVAKAPDEEALNRLEAEITGKLGPLFPLRFHVREVAIEEESENGVWSLCTALALR